MTNDLNNQMINDMNDLNDEQPNDLKQGQPNDERFEQRNGRSDGRPFRDRVYRKAIIAAGLPLSQLPKFNFPLKLVVVPF